MRILRTTLFATLCVLFFLPISTAFAASSDMLPVDQKETKQTRWEKRKNRLELKLAKTVKEKRRKRIKDRIDRKKDDYSFGVVSIIAGIGGVALSIFGAILIISGATGGMGILFAVLGFALSAIALIMGLLAHRFGMANVGFILGIIGCAIGLAFFIIYQLTKDKNI